MKTKIQTLCDKFIADPKIPEYISPSQVNQFLSNKMGFIGRLVGFERKDNINFQKGNTVERAVNFYFKGIDSQYLNIVPPDLQSIAVGNPDASIAASMSVFNLEANQMNKYAETRDYLPSLCMKAINVYNDRGDSPESQVKVNGKMFGQEIYGILDYKYPTYISDCKVTGQTPSKMSQSHKNAAFIYGYLTGMDVVYDYFIPLKKEPKHVCFEFEVDDLTENLVQQAIESIKTIYGDLQSDPELIYKYSRIFLSDPEQGFGDSDEITYYTELSL